MRINLDWLREWIDLRSDANELAERLTTAGLEVEAVLDVAFDLRRREAVGLDAGNLLRDLLLDLGAEG